MPDANDVDNAIAANATGPAKVTTDAGTVEQHALADQVVAANHLSQSQAVGKRPARGLRFNKLIPPGTV